VEGSTAALLQMLLKKKTQSTRNLMPAAQQKNKPNESEK
jgi:septum formation inhibitor-activating ATPase MinD